MADTETLSVYAASAKRYADCLAEAGQEDQADDFASFVSCLPAGARVLDLGCGPGHWANKLQNAGFVVDATDASPEMAALGHERYGLDIRVEPFDRLSDQNHYDGIWANFSLLHAPRAAFSGHLCNVVRALRPGGVLHIGMKSGNGEKRDRLGRFYAYYRENELIDLLTQANLTVIRSDKGKGEGLAGEVETYISILAHA